MFHSSLPPGFSWSYLSFRDQSCNNQWKHQHYVINLPGMTNEILWKIEIFLGRIQMTHSFSISLAFLFVLQTLFKGKLPKSFHKTTLLMMIIYPVSKNNFNSLQPFSIMLWPQFLLTIQIFSHNLFL